MANKRDLKRTINYITSDMFAECVAASLYSSKPADEDVDGILTAIVMIRTDFICPCHIQSQAWSRKSTIRSS